MSEEEELESFDRTETMLTSPTLETPLNQPLTPLTPLTPKTPIPPMTTVKEEMTDPITIKEELDHSDDEFDTEKCLDDDKKVSQVDVSSVST